MGLIRNKNSTKLKKTHPYFVWFPIVLAAFGTLMIMNASMYIAQVNFNQPYRFLYLHLIWLSLGGVIFFFIYNINIIKSIKLINIFNIIMILLLIVIFAYGAAINGSRRWLYLFGFSLQPSELLKVSLVITMANAASFLSDKDKLAIFGTVSVKLLPQLVMSAITSLLILIQPDMGTAMIIVANTIFLYIISIKNSLILKKLFYLIFVGVVFGGILVVIEPYRVARFEVSWHLMTTGEVIKQDSEGLQLNNILMSIGSGGFLGKGYGQSIQKYAYLVENTAFTDSIIAVVFEEFGYLSAIIIFLSFWMLWKTAYSMEFDNISIKYIVLGIVFWIVIQAFINISANIGVIPLTGVPFPLLSYGGSNTLSTIAGFAIIINLSRYRK